MCSSDLEVQLVVPKKLDPDHEALLRQLASMEQANVMPHQKSWFDKVKAMFTGEDSDGERPV